MDYGPFGWIERHLKALSTCIVMEALIFVVGAWDVPPYTSSP